MKKTHIALTIGPVVSTISRARYTRELWAASYLFSYLMKVILKDLRTLEGYTVIMPFSQGEGSDAFFQSHEENHEMLKAEKDENRKKILERYLYGAGLFPDRFILQTDAADGFKTVKDTVQGKVEQFAKDAATTLYRHLSREEKEKTSYQAYEDKVVAGFKQFFRLYLVEQQLDAEENPILAMSTSLATCELQDWFPQEETGFLADLLDQSPGSFLADEAFGGKESFDSLVEVAMRDFAADDAYKKMETERLKRRQKRKSERNQEDAAEEESLVITLSEKYRKTTKEFPAFRPAHKYVAVVHADGDGIGALIEGLKNQDDFNAFSRALKTFALEAVQQIRDFGGVPVYAGGDDLLFFAPVIRDQKSENIFHLLERLNTTLKKHFSGFAAVPTLSFGLNISYYKFPLFEALESSRKLLFERAKHYSPRNAIAFVIRKHSGHEFGGLLPMESGLGAEERRKSVFGQFIAMLQSGAENPGRNLSSINYHIRSNAKMYHLIGSDTRKVENFIDNSFDEAVHGSGQTEQYLGDVKTLLPVVFRHYQGDPDRAADAMYSLLRASAFLTDHETNTENGND